MIEQRWKLQADALTLKESRGNEGWAIRRWWLQGMCNRKSCCRIWWHSMMRGDTSISCIPIPCSPESLYPHIRSFIFPLWIRIAMDDLIIHDDKYNHFSLSWYSGICEAPSSTAFVHYPNSLVAHTNPLEWCGAEASLRSKSIHWFTLKCDCLTRVGWRVPNQNAPQSK